jgi:hypothetical protein
MSSHPGNGHADGGLWPPVTRDRLCPKCHKADWCCLSPDNAFLRCYRSDDGTGKRRTDKAGQEFTLYRLDGETKSGGWDPPRYEHGNFRVADPDVLYRVYKRFLKRLGLLSDHRENLRARGLRRGSGRPATAR